MISAHQNTKDAVHMIGNAHVDPVWLWTWREGSQTIRATFESVLERLNEYPYFVFTASSALSINSRTIFGVVSSAIQIAFRAVQLRVIHKPAVDR